ncbi:serine/threonine-protein phosphatase 7 long form homolog [Apium graveolens]|uniref:serine/threonine-protein phosphatase 7 long form homolog n=1 Tax=Apium graveolens TaxID=4045 RepID=UPI003D7A13DE
MTICLPVNGHTLIADDIPGPSDILLDLVASIFCTPPPSTCLIGARISCSFFSSLTPRILPETVSLDEVMHRTRCYLVHLIAGVLFTDIFGGCINPKYLLFLRDLDSCGEYAWGAVVLAFLYRELCKGCKTDKEEVAGCLLLLQLWAWERLPTLTPIPTDSTLHHSPIFDDQLAGPHGDRWLVSLSYKEMVGRTLSVYRTVLDELAASNFIWQPYSTDIIDSLPPCFLAGCDI